MTRESQWVNEFFTERRVWRLQKDEFDVFIYLCW